MQKLKLEIKWSSQDAQFIGKYYEITCGSPSSKKCHRLDCQDSDFLVCLRAGPASRMPPGFCRILRKVLCNTQGGKLPPT